MLILAVAALLQANISAHDPAPPSGGVKLGVEPGCASKQVRISKSQFGVEAFETIRVCDVNKLITTADNQIFLQTGSRSKPILVVTLSSVGKIGVPLSWNGDTLVVHLPPHYKRQFLEVLHPKVGNVSIEIVNDYSDEQELHDSQ